MAVDIASAAFDPGQTRHSPLGRRLVLEQVHPQGRALEWASRLTDGGAWGDGGQPAVVASLITYLPYNINVGGLRQ
jgi:hypothetical protein